jgi:hypothetical protein
MIGCQEAQHTLKRALLLRRQHGLESYALFVDLVKAFDTVQHPLLFDILKKYGIPTTLIKVIEKMYKNCIVNCKIENESIEVRYNTGVQQGDNASPVLFAYVMQAFLDTLVLETKPTEFRFFKPPKNGNLKALNGRLIGQPTTSKGTAFDFSNVFFVDDSVFLTESREEIELLTPTLINHFKHLGMQMHVGRGNVKSKTEAMFFPDSLKKAKALTASGTLPPDLILPNNQQVQFTHCFKYLGSLISTELNENAEIKTRINKAKATMGRTKHFFSNKDVDIRTKFSVYNAFVINTALWGCESWNLSTRNKALLESFHHSAIRRILNISWEQVRNEKIRNKQVRFRFCNIPKMESYINKRTATYVGKVARSNDDELPKQLLGAWMHLPRKAGGQQLSCNNNFAQAVSMVAPNIPQENQNLLFRDWIPLALDENEWLSLVNKYFESCRTIDENREDGEQKKKENRTTNAASEENYYDTSSASSAKISEETRTKNPQSEPNTHRQKQEHAPPHRVVPPAHDLPLNVTNIEPVLACSP